MGEASIHESGAEYGTGGGQGRRAGFSTPAARLPFFKDVVAFAAAIRHT
ncbi:MAG: hypothetical protein QOG74_2275 [Alphaproteobacteria bacterium]|jgi:hypothetical protein|nr:hypothetical protein [Alphaproteobacteria bacterium]